MSDATAMRNLPSAGSTATAPATREVMTRNRNRLIAMLCEIDKFLYSSET